MRSIGYDHRKSIGSRAMGEWNPGYGPIFDRRRGRLPLSQTSLAPNPSLFAAGPDKNATEPRILTIATDNIIAVMKHKPRPHFLHGSHAHCYSISDPFKASDTWRELPPHRRN